MKTKNEDNEIYTEFHYVLFSEEILRRAKNLIKEYKIIKRGVRIKNSNIKNIPKKSK